jgi:hypothetical protein
MQQPRSRSAAGGGGAGRVCVSAAAPHTGQQQRHRARLDRSGSSVPSFPQHDTASSLWPSARLRAVLLSVMLTVLGVPINSNADGRPAWLTISATMCYALAIVKSLQMDGVLLSDVTTAAAVVDNNGGNSPPYAASLLHSVLEFYPEGKCEGRWHFSWAWIWPQYITTWALCYAFYRVDASLERSDKLSEWRIPHEGRKAMTFIDWNLAKRGFVSCL